MDGIGDRVRRRREALGLSQADLAKRIGKGTTQQAIQQLETGKTRQPRSLLPLARALEVSPDYLEGNVEAEEMHAGTRRGGDRIRGSGDHSLEAFNLLDAEIAALREIVLQLCLEAVLRQDDPGHALREFFEQLNARLDSLPLGGATPYALLRRERIKGNISDVFAGLTKSLAPG